MTEASICFVAETDREVIDFLRDCGVLVARCWLEDSLADDRPERRLSRCSCAAHAELTICCRFEPGRVTCEVIGPPVRIGALDRTARDLAERRDRAIQFVRDAVMPRYVLGR